jgi:hypothetical protein
LNDPRDRDRGWTVELAIPWTAFADSAGAPAPPRLGDAWRVNFSRVQWALDVADGSYRKRADAATGRPLAEDNWVWSPQGVVNMHLPEMWGVVQFGGAPAPAVSAPDDEARWALRRVYYAQREYRARTGRFADALVALGIEGLPAALRLEGTAAGWGASVPVAGSGTRWHIRADGLVWRTADPGPPR